MDVYVQSKCIYGAVNACHLASSQFNMTHRKKTSTAFQKRAQTYCFSSFPNTHTYTRVLVHTLIQCQAVNLFVRYSFYSISVVVLVVQ